MKDLVPYLRLLGEHRWRLAGGALLMLTTAAAGIGLLALAGWFITASAVTGLLLAAGASARLEVFLPGAGIRFFALARTVARYGERLYNHDAVLRLLAALRTRVFARLTPLDPTTLARLRSSLVLNRLTADIDALDALYLRWLAPPVVGLLAIVGVALLLALFAPPAGLTIALLLLAGGGFVTLSIARPGGALGERISRRGEGARTRIIDLVQGLAEWRAFGVITRAQRTLDQLNRELIRDQVRAARLAATGEAGMGLVVHGGAALALWLGVSLYLEGAISGPVAALMPLAVLALAEALTPVPSGLLQLGRTRAAARRLNALVALQPVIREPIDPSPLPAAHDLALDRVSVHYGRTGEPVLTDCSLRVAAGERVAVVGASGTGKSTVANLCARLVDPSVGEVRLGGVALPRLRLADLHARIGYLTQHSEIFADTIAANLRIARAEADPNALWDALTRAGLTDFVDTLDSGLETWVGENGIGLSGGQARRLALARIILRDAPVVLLDEPLAGLDAHTAATVAQHLDTWLAGRTVLLLAHDTTALPHVDRVVHL